MSDELSVYVQEWFKKANNDLRNAEILLNCGDNEIPYDTLCFHCQQASEKYIKGYLICKGMDFPKTHNLADLIGICNQTDISFSKYITEMEKLTPYAVEIRYLDDFYMPSEEEAREAYKIASAIKIFIKQKIADKIQIADITCQRKA